MYTIGQVSELFGLPISTLRYYDKEGLFPTMQRDSGIRKFGEKELEALRVIECLKKSGLEIKDIKQFMAWCVQGSETYPQRRELFLHQKAAVEAEIERMTGPWTCCTSSAGIMNRRSGTERKTVFPVCSRRKCWRISGGHMKMHTVWMNRTIKPESKLPMLALRTFSAFQSASK